MYQRPGSKVNRVNYRCQSSVELLIAVIVLFIKTTHIRVIRINAVKILKLSIIEGGRLT